MTVTISPDDPRSVRALAVLAQAPTWTKGHTKDGRAFFVIPGSKGRIYWTDTRACTCPDARERGVTCKHQLAVRMWTIQQQATAPAPARGPVTATAEDLGLCTDAELDATMLTIKAKHLVRDADRADRAAYRARLRADLGLIDEAA